MNKNLLSELTAKFERTKRNGTSSNVRLSEPLERVLEKQDGSAAQPGSSESFSQPKDNERSPQSPPSSLSKKKAENERGAPSPPVPPRRPPPPPPPSRMFAKKNCSQTEHKKDSSTQSLIVAQCDKKGSGQTVFDTPFALSNELCKEIQKNFEKVEISWKNKKKIGKNELSTELQFFAIILAQLKKFDSNVDNFFKMIDECDLNTVPTDFLQQLVTELRKKKMLEVIKCMDVQKPPSSEVALRFAWEASKRSSLLVHLEIELHGRKYEKEALELRESLDQLEGAATALSNPVMSNLAGCLVQTVNYLNQGSKIPQTETFMLKEFGRILDRKGKSGESIAEMYKDQFAKWRAELEFVQQKLAATRIGFSEVQQDLKVYSKNSLELFHRVNASASGSQNLWCKYKDMVKISNRGIEHLKEHMIRVQKLEQKLQSFYCTNEGFDVMIEEVLRALSLIFKSFEVENKMKTSSSQTTQIR